MGDDSDMSAVLYPGSQRRRTHEAGRDTWHSFSFGAHYEPGNLAFGPLVAHNDERLEAHSGYADHTHRDVELVTYVLSGALVHRDDAGAVAVLTAGTAQVVSAGSGIRHAEVAEDEPTRFIQAWLVPDAPGTPPARSVLRRAELPTGRWTPLAGGSEMPLRCRGASLAVARLAAGEPLTTLPADRVHLFVTAGAVACDAVPEELGDGDAVRLIRAPVARLTARDPAVVLAWSLP
jgi:quercetin 2,3-dioxygenase